MAHPTYYRTIQLDGLSIFYREAGPKDAPGRLTHDVAAMAGKTLLVIAGISNAGRGRQTGGL